ncbi:hypothetical protein ACFFMR_15815 [Micromonospora andamanensis]|uniref:Uncharacterized protein n=1 Tax=Micromonospora andamanensis TaxID=1287068 RepID=A0ABQ4HXT9_9ACTN|nr:hypothetical protein [Micromonospora andamanensis]GIJ10483.1 hypothetical protein Van01_36970 [Micromonospora andamanensis]GIJ41478.1 hypothetical protein Vwe01_48030 [Micromonospora andamanensis]
MASNGNDGSALFLAAPTPDEPTGSGTSVDGSEEAMRALRHPFAVGPASARRSTSTAGERLEQRH